MDKIKELELKKLIKELEYIEENYNYTSEIVSNSDNLFMKAIDDTLENHPDLKEVYNEKLDKTIEDTIKKQIEQKEDEISQEDKESESDKESEESIDQSIEEVEDDLKLKSLYREIAKQTHPDKIKNKKKNAIYIKASVAYKDKDRIAMYRFCDDLDISYDIDEQDRINMKDVIEKYKNKISFLESTFTWKWFNTDDEKIKEDIIMTFIKMKVR